MDKLKVTTWNIEHFSKIFTGALTSTKQKRKAAIAQEIIDIAPDILCVLEGPKNLPKFKEFVQYDLGNEYTIIEASDGDYSIRGKQWIWFLVRNSLRENCFLQPVSIWREFAGKQWKVHYWGVLNAETHRHYRHPQTLILQWNGLRVEFIGAHLKSKYVRKGEQMWKAGGQQKNKFILDSLKARVKMATEADNIRRYMDVKFEQVEHPAIFVLGDLNDGVGRETFEREYLFFDLVSTLQGDVFFARKFLNHALFDYQQSLRWSVRYDDFVEKVKDRPLLIDHIMFTQGLVNDRLPLTIKPHAGFVEHEVHELVNAPLSASSQTSDHRPVSVILTVNEQ